MKKDQELALWSLSVTVNLISCHKKVTKSPYHTAQKSLWREELEEQDRIYR